MKLLQSDAGKNRNENNFLSRHRNRSNLSFSQKILQLRKYIIFLYLKIFFLDHFLWGDKIKLNNISHQWIGKNKNIFN